MVGVAPSVGWLDGGSLTASAWLLGVAHPPGEPGWLAPARLAQLLPVGDIAFRTNLLSALCVAACAAPLLWLTRAMTGTRALWGGAFAVGLTLLGFGARMQAVRTEVYGLVALLLLLALAAAVCWTGRRSSAALGILVGVAAGVHPLLVAAATPALLLARALRSSVGPLDVALAGGFGLLGFAVYGWLPVRATVNPARAWGVPNSSERFVDVLLARAFARNFGGEGSSLIENAAVIGIRHALSGVVLVALLAAVAWILLRDQQTDESSPARRALGWAAPVWLLGNAMTILPQNKVFGTNPDVLGYLFVGTLALAPMGGLGLTLLRERAGGTPIERLAPWLLGAAALAVGLQGLDGLAASRTHNALAREFSSAQGYALPPRSVLVTSGNNTAFLWTYLQAVERRRPEMVALHRVLLGHEHERLRLEEGCRELGVEWEPSLRATPTSALSTVSSPVFIEVRDPEQGALGGVLQQHGLVWGLSAPRLESEALAQIRERNVSALEGPVAFGDEEAALVAGLFRATNGVPR